MRDTKSLLPELVNNGIRLLVYAGNVGEKRIIAIASTSLTMDYSSDIAVNYIVSLYLSSRY